MSGPRKRDWAIKGYGIDKMDMRRGDMQKVSEKNSWSTSKRILLATTVLSLSFIPVSSQVSAQEAGIQRESGLVRFAIPAQPVASAIEAFTYATGWQVTMSSAAISGKKSNSVNGEMLPSRALERMIQGTGLSVQYLGAKSAAIRISGQGSDAASASDGSTTLETIVIQGATDGANSFLASQATTGSKSSIPIAQAPYSVSVVTQKQLQSQNPDTIEQTLRYSPGVYTEAASNDDRWALSGATMRGFSAGLQIDGTRLDSDTGNYSANTDFDPYLLERVEVLNGPASVLYGQAAPGGAISFASKKPLETPFHEVVIGTGSYGRIEAKYDFSGPINKEGTLLYRLTGMGLHTGTQLDNLDNERIAIAPAITWKPDEDTKLTILTSYQHDPKKGGYMSLPWVGTYESGALGKIPRDFYWGEKDVNEFKRTQYTAGYEFEHRFNDTFTFRQNTKYIHVDGYYVDTIPTSLASDGRTLGRYFFGEEDTYSSFNIDNQLETKFSTFDVDHKLLTGYEYFKKKKAITGTMYQGTTSIDIFDPVYGNYTTPTMRDYNSRSGFDQNAIYAQDYIEYGGWRAVAGIRRDWVDNWKITNAGVRSDWDSEATTYRLGLAYVFDNGITPYASYSTSFEPQSGTGAPERGSQAFKPTTGTQYEVGVKYKPDWIDGIFTISAFDLTQANVLTTDPDYDNYSLQVGKVRSRGITASANLNVTDSFNLIASYTYNKLETAKSTDDDTTYIVGNTPWYNPRHTGSIWGEYTFDESVIPGLTVGAGVRLRSADYIDSSETLKLPGHALFDAALRYDFGAANPDLKGLEGTFNVSNIFDKEYLAACTKVNGSCRWGDGRSVIAQLKYRW